MKKVYSINRSFMRFVVVGIINTLFGVGLYCLFLYWGMTYHYAVLLSTVLGVLFNFKTIGAFVFRYTKNTLIFKFVAVYVIVYLINISMIHLLLKLTLLDQYIAGIVVTPMVAISSYLLQKKFVFNK